MIILVVEDEPEQLELITTVLEGERYVVDKATDGQDALSKIEVRDYDLVIIDLDLPVLSGQELVARMRQLGLSTPALILTANDELGSKVTLLNSGADDYLTKPFAVSELLARVGAILRRPKQEVANTFQTGDLEIRYGTHEVAIGGQIVKLTRNEFRLLDFLARKSDRICTRTMIEEHVWGYDQEHTSNLIEAVIYKLRKKIGRYHGDLIETVQNIGYRFNTKR